MLRYVTHQPQRLAHWGREDLDRLGNARLGISVVSNAGSDFLPLAAYTDVWYLQRKPDSRHA